MKINFMTWNTQLYEYGNIIWTDQSTGLKKVKDINYSRCIDTINIIREHMSKENAVVVLQEIPLRSNITHSEHIVWTLLRGVFPKNEYTILYNVQEGIADQIKTTVVIAKIGLIEFDDEKINTNKKDYCNCFVSFKVKNADLQVLAVHQKDNVYASDRLNKDKPNIILGDFNAGDYTKIKETEQFQKNRDNYKKLLAHGYTDICCGQITSMYSTPIDHILIDDKNVNKGKKLDIVPDRRLSDHWRITLEFEC